MGLPNKASGRLGSKNKATSNKTSSKAVSRSSVIFAGPIDERMRDRVLNAILDSLLDTPEQTREFQASETNRIASRFNIRPLAVAGVRANMTRGCYNPVATLLKARRAERKARSQKRMAATKG